MARVRVVGCGSPGTADDAVGLVAARLSRAELRGLAEVEVLEAGPAIRVLDLLDDTDALVVVDAVRTPLGGRAPGTLVRAEAGPEGLPAELGASLSSHGFGLGEVVGLAAAMGRAPRIVFLGVEAASAAAGFPLSPAVADALPDLVRGVVEEARRLVKEVPA